MSILEFENAVHALGVERLVSLIQEKWASGFADIPLSIFFTKVLGQSAVRVEGTLTHLRCEDDELFLGLGMSKHNHAAEWPL